MSSPTRVGFPHACGSPGGDVPGGQGAAGRPGDGVGSRLIRSAAANSGRESRAAMYGSRGMRHAAAAARDSAVGTGGGRRRPAMQSTSTPVRRHYDTATRTAVTLYSGQEVTVSATSEVRRFTPLAGKWKEQKTCPGAV